MQPEEMNGQDFAQWPWEGTYPREELTYEAAQQGPSYPTEVPLTQGVYWAEPSNPEKMPAQSLPWEEPYSPETPSNQETQRVDSYESTVICEFCGKTLTGAHAMGNLLRHQRSKACLSTTERNGYKCPDCSKMFRRLDSLLNHLRRRHPEALDSPLGGIQTGQVVHKSPSLARFEDPSRSVDYEIYGSGSDSQSIPNRPPQEPDHRKEQFERTKPEIAFLPAEINAKLVDGPFTASQGPNKSAEAKNSTGIDDAEKLILKRPGTDLGTSPFLEMPQLQEEKTQLEGKGQVLSAPEAFDEIPTMRNTKTPAKEPSPKNDPQEPEIVHEDSFMSRKDHEFDVDDAGSVVSSYAASVFSLPSLASSATDLTKDSGYSAEEIFKATTELLNIVHHDADLAPLYLSAIKDPSIGPQRLQRNLRRIFRQYGENLKNEATDQFEFLVSRLVTLKADFLAQVIVKSYDESTTTTEHTFPHTMVGESKPVQASNQEDEEKDDEERGGVDIETAEFGDLITFREFLIRSSAFETLRSQFRTFAQPKLPQSELNRKEEQERTIAREETSVHQEIDKTNSEEAETATMQQRIIQMINKILIATGHLESPLEPGMVRLRWQCRCGENFTSDVNEYEMNGTMELIAQIENMTGSRVTSTPSSPNSTNQRYIYQRPVLWLQRVLGLFANILKRPSQQNILPQHGLNTAVTHTNRQTNPRLQSVLLLACMRSKKYGRNLHQDCIETIETDRQLFQFLRDQLTRCRGSMQKILSLRRVKGICFVKFNLFMGGSVEIRHHKDCCKSICECIPPRSYVEPSSQAQYRCNPAGPLNGGPPIPPSLLSHFLANPSCIDEHDNSVLNRLPKRICGELQGKIGDPAEGWGIYYEEGWDGDVITLIIFLVFLAGSLLFALLWTCFKKDVQAAFGVSAYAMTAAGVIIPLVATRASKM